MSTISNAAAISDPISERQEWAVPADQVEPGSLKMSRCGKAASSPTLKLNENSHPTAFKKAEVRFVMMNYLIASNEVAGHWLQLTFGCKLTRESKLSAIFAVLSFWQHELILQSGKFP